MRRLIIAAAALLCAFTASGQEQDLRRLDAMILQSQNFVTGKLGRIDELNKRMSVPGIPAEAKFEILDDLFQEEFPFKYSAAMNIVIQKENLARELGNQSFMNDVLLDRAELYSTAGMFLEAQTLIESEIDTTAFNEEQKERFFYIAQRFFGDYREYSGNAEIRDSFTEKQGYYRSRLFEELDTTSLIRNQVLVQTLLDEDNLSVAQQVCDRTISRIDPREHIYAVFAYFRAAIAERSGDYGEAVHWYTESAICDVICAVKDNASIMSLANLILSKGEVERAFNYLQVALDDALFYDARLRPFQIARSLPHIQLAYEKDREEVTGRVIMLLVIISIVAVLLFAICLYAFKLYRRTNRAGKQIAHMQEDLHKAVNSLSEANAAKEEYLGLFLSMCSSYLDKLKKHVSMKEMDEELKAFYNTFDNAFLNLYPTFVQDFNAMLKDEYKIELKKDEMLNTELRIFALIKLGVDQSSHIASLLRYSVNTIYNYRAQVKKAAIESPETFEERIKQL